MCWGWRSAVGEFQISPGKIGIVCLIFGGCISYFISSLYVLVNSVHLINLIPCYLIQLLIYRCLLMSPLKRMSLNALFLWSLEQNRLLIEIGLLFFVSLSFCSVSLFCLCPIVSTFPKVCGYSSSSSFAIF